MEYIKKSALLLIALLIAGAVSEWFARYSGFSPVSHYLQRYIVDGRHFPMAGYVADHKNMPFSLKRRFAHTVVDRAWFPTTWLLTTNDEGYRNSENADGRQFDRLVVGDSVAFGFGVFDEFSIARNIARLSGKRTYDASIPGAGPAMYLYLIEEFFSRSWAERVTLFFYDGNDYANLAASEWSPMGSDIDHETILIQRDDISCSPGHLPVFLSYPLLRDSAIAVLLARLGSGTRDCSKFAAADFLNVSKSALLKLDYEIKRQEYLAENKPEALGAIGTLKKTACAASMRSGLEGMQKDIENDNVENIYPSALRVTEFLIESDCLPISPSKRNAVSFFHYYAGFYYYELFSLDRGEDGEIRDLMLMLNGVSRERSDVQKFALQAINILKSKEHSTQNMEDLANLLSNIQEMLPLEIDSRTPGEEKVAAFLSYLVTLEESKRVRVEIVILPAEYRLKDYPDYRNGATYELCRDASSYALTCINLIPNFQEYYSNNQGPALALDGSHFTERGNELVARWLLDAS